MRRIVLWASSTVAALVLLLGYHTSTSGVAAPAQQPIGSGTPGTAGTSGTTVTGDTVHTRWGPVQVQVTTDNGTITSVQVVQYPSENGRDLEINNRALPILVDETLAAQSAEIDMVSGATVTSVGYVDSLQSALDQAGL